VAALLAALALRLVPGGGFTLGFGLAQVTVFLPNTQGQYG